MVLTSGLSVWRCLVPIPDISLEQLERRLEGADKDGLLQLISKMLCWVPEGRLTAKEVITYLTLG